MHSDEVGLLRRAVGLASRSAVAYKTAYMLTGEDGAEAALLECCAARYALLERLLGLLAERSVSIGQVRDLLDGIDMDPARYGGEIDAAMADARRSDAVLEDLAAAGLAEVGITAATGACLRELAAEIGAGSARPTPAVAGLPGAVVAGGSTPFAEPTV